MTPPAAARALPVHRMPAPARALVPPRPRRISGPSRPARERQATAAPASRALGATLGAAARDRVAALLDRLLSGRAWIGVVAFALIGIVTLQLGLLQLNRSIGRTLERETALQRENSAISIENSEAAAGTRVEASAEKLGMTLVPPGALHFLRAQPRTDPARAAAALRANREATGEPQSSSTAEASGQSAAGAQPSEATSESGSASVSGGEPEAHPAPASSPSREATPTEAGPSGTSGASGAGGSSGAGPESSAGAAAAPSGGAESSPAG